MKNFIFLSLISFQAFATNFSCETRISERSIEIRLTKIETINSYPVKYSIYFGQDTLPKEDSLAECKRLARGLNKTNAKITWDWRHTHCEDWRAFQSLALIVVYGGQGYLLWPQDSHPASGVIRESTGPGYRCEVP